VGRAHKKAPKSEPSALVALLKPVFLAIKWSAKKSQLSSAYPNYNELKKLM